MIDHECGLTSLDDDIAPEVAFRFDEVSSSDGQFDRHVDVLFVEHGDEETGTAAHGSVCGVRAESGAIDGVVRISGGASDDVAWVDIFEVNFDVIAFCKFFETISEVDTDIVEDFITGGVNGVRGFKDILPCAFGDEDDGVMTSCQTVFEAFPETAGTLDGEGDFGYEDVVDVIGGESGIGGDEARFSAHDFDQSETIDGVGGFGMSGIHGLDSAGDGGFESEGALNEAEVIIDGFRDADDCEFSAACFGFIVEGESATLRAIAADGEEDIHIELFDGVHNSGRIGAAARRAQNGAAVSMDHRDAGGFQFNGFVAVFRQKATISEGNTQNITHAVLMPERHDEGADDVVESRAETTASHDAGANFFGVEVEFFSRTCFFEHMRFGKGEILQVVCQGEVDIVHDIFVIADIVGNKVVQTRREMEGRRNF